MLSSSFAPGLPSKIATNSCLDSVEMFTPSTAKKQSPASVNVHEHERVCARAYMYMHGRVFSYLGMLVCARTHLLSHTEATKLGGAARLNADDFERTA
jgi:hypothetical protein